MELRNRVLLRLPAYDYTANGAYYVTICTHNRREILSRICRGDPCGRPEIQLTHLGRIAAKTFPLIAERFRVSFDTWIVMPDHIHFVVTLPEARPDFKAVELGQIVGAYKSMVTREWLAECKTGGRVMGKIWQRNYYEHVIRNEEDLNEIRAYIAGNPGRWLEEQEYTHR